MTFFQKIFGDPNAKVIRDMQPLVDAINALESDVQKLSDDALRAKTGEFRRRLGMSDEQRQTSDDTNLENDHRETIDDLLPEAFAVVREAARRVLGQRHFDVQLMGGIVLHRGGIAEMRTGEGKTLTATLAVYLNALSGKGVHVITVNDYLARRDALWMGRVYHALGLTVGSIQHETAFRYTTDSDDATRGALLPVTRKEAYAADITYGTNNEFGFDYLRDHMVLDSAQMVQRPLHYSIIDEVDSILIDEARTPLIISAPAQDSTDQYARFAQLVRRLTRDEDYNVDEKMRAATLTESGLKKMEQWLGVENIYTAGGVALAHHIEQALRAEALFTRDRDYVVKEEEVIIVDEFTGRLMPGRRYSEGLHQAIEAKEGVKVQRESETLATITFQNYFRMYEKLAGMTGTAATEAEEFHKIYQLEVTVIPTHRPMVRRDAGDRIYRTEHGKFSAVVSDIKQYHERGQPVLVGTISIEKNEVLSEMLTRAGIPHAMLNAKHHEKEAHIIAEAGRKGAVTIATNMAGRGVDIVLGGAPPNEGTPEGEAVRRTHEEWQKEHDEVLALGGLHVIGTERHESRRIDNQLRGRAGRQGDPGSTQFYISLDDDLMRIFGSDRMKSMMQRLRVPDDMPIEHRMITRSIEAAQRKVETHHFDLRKHLLEYDDVLNKHREVMYRKRTDILDAAQESYATHEACALRKIILDMVSEEINSVVAFHTAGEDERQWNLKEIYEVMGTIFPFPEEERKQLTDLQSAAGDRAADAAARTRMIEYCLSRAEEHYRLLEQRFEKQQSVATLHQLERQLLLRSIDTLWVEHLDANTRLREGIGLRGYGQRDPLVEYQREAYRLFQELLSLVRKQVVYAIFKVGAAFQIAAPSLLERQGISVSAPAKGGGSSGLAPSFAKASEGKKVGRNDPCPCGATREDGRPKKYKHCHGKSV